MFDIYLKLGEKVTREIHLTDELCKRRLPPPPFTQAIVPHLKFTLISHKIQEKISHEN